MKAEDKRRRRFIKTGFAASLFAYIPWHSVVARTENSKTFSVPDTIYRELVRLYGSKADHVVSTDRISISAPDIAENGAVVAVGLKGEEAYVSSAALFLERNPKPLAATFTVRNGSDLPMGTRVKLARTSNVYFIADTSDGLVGTMKEVKVTIGCGGG